MGSFRHSFFKTTALAGISVGVIGLMTGGIGVPLAIVCIAINGFSYFLTDFLQRVELTRRISDLEN